MNINEAINLIKENEGAHTYTCHLPTLDKTVSFRPLTVSELKSVAKISIDGEDLYTGLTALMQILCINDLDMTQLSEIDKTKALLTIKVANQLGDDVYNLTCNECDANFNYDVPILNLIENNFNEPAKSIKLSLNANNIKYDLTISIPSLKLSAMYSKFVEGVTKQISESNYTEQQSQEIMLHMIRYGNLIFVKELFINDEIIEGFDSDTPLDKRNSILDMLPGKIIQKINETIENEPSFDLQSKLTCDIICPKCKTPSKLVIDLLDFFQI